MSRPSYWRSLNPDPPTSEAPPRADVELLTPLETHAADELMRGRADRGIVDHRAEHHPSDRLRGLRDDVHYLVTPLDELLEPRPASSSQELDRIAPAAAFTFTDGVVIDEAGNVLGELLEISRSPEPRGQDDHQAAAE